MGRDLTSLANFSAHQAKLHCQSMPKARQRGPEARQCMVLSDDIFITIIHSFVGIG